MADHQFTNRLTNETSPYLRQHAHNPVDWYPWGPEALDKARREDKPIFLSIGYSACHWCHVMEHESFEDPATAAIMNEHYVNIKVDREERPDLDHIYMAAVQMMTRHGGWPMSVFLTPDLEPFFGGTYFPPEPRHGMPSFQQILHGVADAWRNRRGDVLRSAGGLAAALRQMNEATGAAEGTLSLEMVDQAVRTLERDFEPRYGGFGGAPKFPHSMDLRLCLRHWKRTGSEQSMEMVTQTLDHMARGGIYDHLGGGFHRYSTDERWLVPHFEKMLYDNALLTQTYLEAYQATKNSEFETVARETLEYVLREMTSPEGGFYSTQDADSEGVEGKFFVWTLGEVEQILGSEEAAAFAYVYDVTAEGNWEDQNILNRPKTVDQCARLLGRDPAELERSLAESRVKLLEVRSRRVPPGRDDKVLVSWNGLMIDAMTRGYQVMGDQRFLDAARRAADFVLTRMRANASSPDPQRGETKPHDPSTSGAARARLLHSYKDGQARFNAYLDDYAALIDGLVSLYESDFDPAWLAAALELAEIMVEQFWDETGGSFFFTGRDHEQLVARVRDVHDSATPSGNSLAITALLRLGRLTARREFTEKAERALKSFTGVMDQLSRAAGQLLIALDFLLNRPVEIVVTRGAGAEQAEESARVLSHIRGTFLPNKVVAARSDGPEERRDRSRHAQRELEGRSADTLVPMLHDKPAVEGKVTVYLCENYACQAPLVGYQAVRDGIE